MSVPAVAPVWYFTDGQLQNTPSRAAGIPYEAEITFKKEGALFLKEVAISLKLYVEFSVLYWF